MYVDESGDCGKLNSPTRFFILSAIVVHELRWRSTLEDLVDFRRKLRDEKGLKLRDEIHSSEMINRPGELLRIKRNDRLDILKKCIDWLNARNDLSLFSVVIDKDRCSKDVFELAWTTLIQRFENTLNYNNFKGPRNPDDKGIILSDNTEGLKLRALLRKMRHYNTIPNRADLYGDGFRNLVLRSVVEDPVFRDSKYSFLHQMCDVVAYFCRQKYEPNAYVKKKGGHKFYDRLSSVVCQSVTKRNNLGIVEA